jgi:uncharacterized protein with LGFP repeats
MRRIYLTFAAILLTAACDRTFAATALVNTCQTIDQKYESLGGMTGALGAPVSDERVTPLGDGRYRQYQWGYIFWSPQTCAHEVRPPISAKWFNEGAEHGPLGYPLTDLTYPGSADKVPVGTAPEWNYFQTGAIYALPIQQATEMSGYVLHEVQGSIWQKYRALGAEQAFLGYPISDGFLSGDGAGRYNHFQNGSIYWTPQTDAHEVHGAIREKWKSMGSERSQLGYPVTDETGISDGIGRYNHFQNGSIYWTPATGAHELHGKIRDHWANQGWERGYAGYPITDVIALGQAYCGSEYARFQHITYFWLPWSGPGGSILESYDPQPSASLLCPASGDGGGGGGGGNTGTLTGSYYFDTLGNAPYPVTVYFSGSPAGSSGPAVFSISRTAEITPGAGAAHVDFSISGLSTGSWQVSAVSTVAGPVSCPARVPGFVSLNVSGGRVSCGIP